MSEINKLYKWYNKLEFKGLTRYGNDNCWRDSYITHGSTSRDQFLYNLTYREVLIIKMNFEELRWNPSFVVGKEDEITDYTEEMIPFLVEWLERDFGKLEWRIPPNVSRKCADTSRDILVGLGVDVPEVDVILQAQEKRSEKS